MTDQNKGNFAWPVTSVNGMDFKAFMEWSRRYEDLIKSKKIIIFGAGIRGTSFLKFLERKGASDVVFTDNNKAKVGGHIDGVPIVSVEEAYGLVDKGGTVILVSTEACEDIVRQLHDAGYERNRHFFTIITDEYRDYVKEFARPYDGAHLFMGDCEFSNISLADHDTRNLSDMLKDAFGIEHTKVIAMHGMHLRSQYHVFMQMVKRNEIPRKFFLMINLDTLTGKQHLLPRSQHAALLRKVWEESGRDGEFGEYVRIAEEREKNVTAEFLIRSKRAGSEALKKTQHANYFRLNYMYKLDPEVEGLQYLRKIAAVCREKNICFMPFVPPVNFEYAEKLLPDKFLTAYGHNQEILHKILEDEKLGAIDFSFSCGSDMFAEPDTPDETTNDKGRLFIVERFENEVNSIGK